MKKRIQEIRRELIALAESESDRTQVVQLNLQLFPLSQAQEGKPAPRSKPETR
jgi:hypothetical protein